MATSVRNETLALLAQHAKQDKITEDDQLFGGGVNLSSVRFAEFILDFEDRFNVEVDIDGVDETVVTVGDFLTVLKAYHPDL